MNLRLPRPFLALLFLLPVAPAVAADPTGMWLTEAGKSHVRLAKCGERLCATIVWLRDPIDPHTGKPFNDILNADPSKRSRPIIGLQIIGSMRGGVAEADQWEGELYNPEDGKTYNGSLKLVDARTITLTGCSYRIFCKSQTWSRISDTVVPGTMSSNARIDQR